MKFLSTYVLDKHSGIPDELLYGRAGYLTGLLYLNSNIFPAPIEADLIKKVRILYIRKACKLIFIKKYESINFICRY